MSLAYFDTSALVKNYVREAGSSRLRALLGRYGFLSSAITPIELQSALQRRLRQRDIPLPHYDAILSQVTNDRSYWQLVEAIPLVLHRAEQLTKTESVRTLDAIHIASAMVVQESFPAPIPFVSADERQIAAARSCGLNVIAFA